MSDDIRIITNPPHTGFHAFDFASLLAIGASWVHAMPVILSTIATTLAIIWYAIQFIRWLRSK